MPNGIPALEFQHWKEEILLMTKAATLIDVFLWQIATEGE